MSELTKKTPPTEADGISSLVLTPHQASATHWLLKHRIVRGVVKNKPQPTVADEVLGNPNNYEISTHWLNHYRNIRHHVFDPVVDACELYIGI